MAIKDFKKLPTLDKKKESNVIDALKKLQKDRVAGTVLIFTKKEIYSRAKANKLVREIIDAAREHIVVCDSALYKTQVVFEGNYTRSVDSNLISYQRHHSVLVATADEAKAQSHDRFRVYLYPGLLYMSKKTITTLPNRLSVVLATSEVQTSRDRVGKLDRKALISIGKVNLHLVFLNVNDYSELRNRSCFLR
jgi:hypothetical protein